MTFDEISGRVSGTPVERIAPLEILYEFDGPRIFLLRGRSFEPLIKVGYVSQVAHTRDDIANIRTNLRELRSEVRDGLKAANESISGLRTNLAEVKDRLADVKTNLAEIKGSVKADINALETKIIKWIIGTVLTAGTLGFSIAKIVG